MTGERDQSAGVVEDRGHGNANTESLTMNRLLIFIGMALGGYVGWWAGDYMGLDVIGAFLVSSLGSAAGVYLAWRIMRDYLG